MMRRSRMRAPTWSSIAAVDRPLFGFAMLVTYGCVARAQLLTREPSRHFRQRELPMEIPNPDGADGSSQ
jgi:hypothetical protein